MKIYAQLIYGLAGAPFPYGMGYSMGLDTIAASLKALGCRVDLRLHGITRYEFTSRNAAFVKAAKAQGETPILVGHSLGADEITMIPPMLPDISFPLVACIDPTNWWKGFGTGPVPLTKNVTLAFDFFQRNVSPGGGQLVKAAGSSTQIVSRNMPKDIHVTIDDDPVVRAQIVDAVRNILGR